MSNKGNTERHKQNTKHAKNPQPGDYWHEMLCPILVVLKATKFQVWVCEERKDTSDGYWTWDLIQTKILTRKTFEANLKYDTIDDKHWCSVIPKNQMWAVKEYEKMSENPLELRDIPPTTQGYTDAIFKAYPILDLNVNASGLCGEADEFANKVKQRMYKQVPTAEMIEELADTLWHVAQCAHLLDSSLDELMSISMKKTLQRNDK